MWGCMVLVFWLFAASIWLFVMGWGLGFYIHLLQWHLRHKKAPSWAGLFLLLSSVILWFHVSYLVYSSFLVLPVFCRLLQGVFGISG